jgi:hypothetical protein
MLRHGSDYNVHAVFWVFFVVVVVVVDDDDNVFVVVVFLSDFLFVYLIVVLFSCLCGLLFLVKRLKNIFNIKLFKSLHL